MEALETPADVPVTTNGIPIRNLWYMLSYAWNDRRLLKRQRNDIESAPSLDGLLARILLSSFSRRQQIGLGRDYRVHDQTLSGIRGESTSTQACGSLPSRMQRRIVDSTSSMQMFKRTRSLRVRYAGSQEMVTLAMNISRADCGQNFVSKYKCLA